MFGLVGLDGADSGELFTYVSTLKHIADDNNFRSDFLSSSARWFLYSTRRDQIRPRFMYVGHVPNSPVIAATDFQSKWNHC